MNTKILYATLGVALALGIGFVVHKKMNKKPCGCGCDSKEKPNVGIAKNTATQEMANATGRTNKMAFPGACLKCRTQDGSVYVPSRGTNCDFSDGERCLTS